MKDGIYALRFEADGYQGEGEFHLRGNRGESHDGKFRIEGHFIERPTSLSAVFNVPLLPTDVPNSRLPDHYALDISSTSDDDRFSLIGIGPLGIIVDIDAQWREPLARERARTFAHTGPRDEVP